LKEVLVCWKEDSA